MLLDELSCLLIDFQHIKCRDKWIWGLDHTKEFTGNYSQQFIDDHLLDVANIGSRWKWFVRRKMNFLAQRVLLNRFSNRPNMVCCGVNVPSVLCS